MKRIKQFERTDRDITNALLLLLEKNRFEKSLWLRFCQALLQNYSSRHFSVADKPV